MNIATFLHWIQETFGLHTSNTLSNEELQKTFQTNYGHFRSLLTANNNALEAMASMEKRLMETQSFSMVFVRTKATIITINVFKMIQDLLAMSEGRYSTLRDVFTIIEQDINRILEPEHSVQTGPWFYPLSAVRRSMVELTGEKMANLGETGSLDGVVIPQGFVITSAAGRFFFTNNDLYTSINRIIQQIDPNKMDDLHHKSHKIIQLILNCSFPKELEEQIYEQYDLLMKDFPQETTIAVRSSSLGEDLGHASFAGLYHTDLYVDREDLIYSCKRVLASTYSPRALSYRLEKGFLHEDMLMAIGCLVMIPAQVSGITYSQSISGSSGKMDIFVSKGGAKGIVEGTKDTLHYVVHRQTPHELVRQNPAENDKDSPLLTKEQRTLVAATAMQLEKHFSTPQDIEWSFNEEGQLYVLQSRPVSSIAKDFLNSSISVDPEKIILQGGVTACPGAASGEIFKVRSSVDLLKFPEKAILVVEHPLPDWAPLLRKAVALIAESGSEAGHLATIAREFGLPAVFSLKNALNTLPEKKTLTIDATHRRIYQGKIDELLTTPESLAHPMEGSPVYTKMVKVLQKITPLNLTDPTSPYFRSRYCETLHDITRFCHEKSVIEMFGFGKRYSFDKGSAKRLVDNMPLEWWVINLADGFVSSYSSTKKYINITDIVSTPMQALWYGMHAIPWQGPPEANLKSMGALFFQSTKRTGIDPATRSNMNRKNYFLVSLNYCNLSVRLGYHYAMVDAYISSLRTERYVTFRFKGGAADETNRLERVNLLAEVLKRYNFRVELTHDSLRARVEKRSQEFLFSRLAILGYLVIHTRQIDMVMTDAVERQRYRDKFINEIEEMSLHEKVPIHPA